MVLIDGEIAGLRIINKYLLFSLLDLLHFILQTETLLFCTNPIFAFLEDLLHVLWLSLFFDTRPDLHDGILQFDPLLILLQVIFILIRYRLVVVKNVVKGNLVLLFLEYTHQQFLVSILQVFTILHDLCEPIVRELEATDLGPADVLCLCLKLQKEALMF